MLPDYIVDMAKATLERFEAAEAEWAQRCDEWDQAAHGGPIVIPVHRGI